MKVQTIQGEAVKCVLPWKANVGECPTWSSKEQCLYWVDILEKQIHRFHPHNQANETFTLPDIVPCIGLREQGGLVLTLKKNFAFFHPDTGKLETLSAVESDQPLNRFNDGKVDPQGRFWAGTMDSVHWDQPAGHLFCMSKNRTPEIRQSDVICSNGTGWSPDSRTMYYTESFRYTVFAYDFEPETGHIRNRRPFVEIDKHMGFPDGLTVDAEGCVWINIVGPGKIHRYDSKGKLERVIQTSVQRATSCTFGGADLKTLYITSSRETLNPSQLKEAPQSGSLFAVETNIKGLEAASFVG